MNRLCRTKLWISLLLPILFLLVLFSSFSCATQVKAEASIKDFGAGSDAQALTTFSTIGFGETISGCIGAPAETDAYTFIANAGDVILLGITKVSGNLWPRIRLYDAASNLLEEETTFDHAEIIHESVTTSPTFKIYLPIVFRNCTGLSASTQLESRHLALSATASGTYTILVSDGFNGTFTGEYNLFLQRLNSPVDSIPIAFGKTFTSTINLPAEMDTFSFSANAGDEILIGATQLSDVWPRVQLFDPQGHWVREHGTHTHFEITQTLSTAGNYTLLFNDSFGGDSTGDYALHLQRLNPPADPANLSYGQTITGTISMPAEMDAYTFSGTAGDTILIGATQISDVWPGIQLFDPQGNLLTAFGTHTHFEITHTLSVAGNYTILFDDSFKGGFTGDYALHLQRLNPPANPASLSYGQTITETISMPAEMDAYTFSGNSGDTICIAATQLSDVWPRVQLFNPHGSLLVAQTGHTYFEVTHTLSMVGTHTILINDGFNGRFTGNYNITLTKLP
jgi:hypothetical protein